MRMIPARIVPFWTIRTEHFILLTLPAIASFNPMVLVESNRLNLLRLWLRAEVRALRFGLLHLLRSRLLHLGPRISLRVLLAGCRSWRSCICPSRRRTTRCFRRRRLLLHTFLALFSLLLPAVRGRFCFTTGNIRSRRRSICRFLVRASLPAFSSTRLARCFTGRFSGDVRFCRGRRSVARVSFLGLFRARLIRGRALIRRAAFLHRSGLLRRPLLRLGGVRAGLRLSRLRFFRGALAL